MGSPEVAEISRVRLPQHIVRWIAGHPVRYLMSGLNDRGIMAPDGCEQVPATPLPQEPSWRVSAKAVYRGNRHRQVSRPESRANPPPFWTHAGLRLAQQTRPVRFNDLEQNVIPLFDGGADPVTDRGGVQVIEVRRRKRLPAPPDGEHQVPELAFDGFLQCAFDSPQRALVRLHDELPRAVHERYHRADVLQRASPGPIQLLTPDGQRAGVVARCPPLSPSSRARPRPVVNYGVAAPSVPAGT